MTAAPTGRKRIVRKATPADAEALTRFTCGGEDWYRIDAQEFVRRRVAPRVAQGLGAWLLEENGEIRGIAAHEPRPHPSGDGRTVTFISVVALAETVGEPWVVASTKVAALLRALMREVTVAPRTPLCYTLVAVENLPMRRFCERYGFISTPVPSNPSYLFYARGAGPATPRGIGTEAARSSDRIAD